MKLVRPLTLALAFVALGAPTWAAQDDPLKAHHPAGSASAAVTKPMSGKTSPDRARMANQTKAMQAMHGKMMAAKTPEERSALMGEHMKSMQEGMDMMKGMGGMAGPKSPATNMTERQTMMEQRMDLMQTMMEMMVWSWRHPRLRTHFFAAQPPDLRHLVLIMRALRFYARSPSLAAPSIRFLSICSQLRFTLPSHTRSPPCSCASLRSM